MRLVFFAGVAMAALAATSTAQTPAASAGVSTTPTTQAQGANALPKGTVIAAELSKSVDAKKAKVGDRIETTLPADVLLHGKVVIPRNTKIIGHVSEVKVHSKESPDSAVGIAFDRVVMKDGHDLTAELAIQAVGRPLMSAAMASSTLGEDAASGGSVRPAGGVMMGSSMPSRSSERVGAMSPAGSDATDADRSTVAPLGPTSQGVVGIKGLELKASDRGSVISSQTDNVRLSSGTQLMLRTQ